MLNKIRRLMLRTGLVILTLLLLFAAFIAALCGYNRHMLAKGAALIQHQGQYVEIDGANMNIYTEGSGDQTLVFMAGANTPAVIYDFKPLFSLLSDTYRIAVIEKFGYGYSDDADGLTNARLVQLQCGHYVHAEEPDAVSAEIRNYLNEVL